MQTCGADCAKKREELFGFIDGKREEMLAFWKDTTRLRTCAKSRLS